ncbi:MAG: DUF1461 domain-containing protein [Nanoarchaeota archaeon]
MKKSGLIFLIVILLIIIIPQILTLLAAKNITFDENFYRVEFVKHEVYENFPDVNEVNSKLLHYLRYDKTDNLVDIDKYNDREKQHLLDVKWVVQGLLSYLNYIAIACVVLIITLFFLNKKEFTYNMGAVCVFGGGLTFLLALLIVILSQLNFGFLFTKFHQAFFKAGTWLFSAEDNLIKIYQEKIFFDILQNILFTALFLAGIVLVIGLLLKTKKYIKKGKH